MADSFCVDLIGRYANQQIVSALIKSNNSKPHYLPCEAVMLIKKITKLLDDWKMKRQRSSPLVGQKNVQFGARVVPNVVT